jgi:hypothetical protein
MTRMLPKLLAASALLALTACGTSSTSWDRELGSEVDKGQFGNATMNNTLIQTGEMSYTVALAERFSAEVPDTINFAFNSAELSEEAVDPEEAGGLHPPVPGSALPRLRPHRQGRLERLQPASRPASCPGGGALPHLARDLARG